jgi:uncharacterized protein YceK
MTAGCPMVATHAVLNLHHDASAAKELLMWDNAEHGWCIPSLLNVVPN